LRAFVQYFLNMEFNTKAQNFLKASGKSAVLMTSDGQLFDVNAEHFAVSHAQKLTDKEVVTVKAEAAKKKAKKGAKNED